MEVRSRAFRDDEDWLAYLRDAIARPEDHPEVVAPVARGLVEIEAAAKGSPQEARVADAALSLFESGTAAERDAVQALALRAAPDAAPRLRVLLRAPDLPAGARLRCADELLCAAPEDPFALDVLRKALATPGD
ncbi:MAG TPA: hypothetical protein VN253_21540, partial [Kofleriaceae bacterium]|nr:hypothetical protein [Kofleriaceae bacterium]